MDFKLVAENILTAFKNAEVRYALMGGFALGIWGVHRTTVDMDFLVHRDDLEKIVNIMTEMGYESIYQSENVSQYVSPMKNLGEIDFLHAFRQVSLGMLARAEEKEIFAGKLKIKVLRPEDLIGMKIQAMTNDPSRQTMDLNDIAALMSLHGSKMDWNLLEDYFAIFGFGEMVKELREKHGGAH